MEQLPQDQIYLTGITLMKLIGERMRYTSKKLLIYRAVNIIVIAFLAILNLANFFHIEAEMFVKTTESSVVIIHVLLKYCLFIYHKRTIEQIWFDRRKKFWKYQVFEQDIVEVCDDIFKRTKFIQIIFVLGAYTAVFLYVLRPCFGSSFILETWIVRDTISFNTIVLAMQYYAFSITVSVVFGYDSIYSSFCVDIIVQVRLLKYKLKQLTMMESMEEMAQEMIDCVRHHQLLLVILERMKGIYSVILLFHYFNTLVGSCVELYELILGHLEVSRIFGNFMNVSMLLTEFAYYTFPAEFVTFEFSNISSAIYKSRWYNCNVDIQRSLLLIMIKSQRITYFSGAGLVDINVATFGSLLRKILSFYAVLKNLLTT